MELEKENIALKIKISKLTLKNLELKKQITSKNDGKKIQNLREEIEKIKEIKNTFNLGFNKGDFVYIKYTKDIDDEKTTWSTHAFVSKEIPYHVKLIVYDRKRHSAYKYCINKECVLGIKHYDGDKDSVISYEKLQKLWKNHNGIE